MINNNGSILPFILADESIGDTSSIWTLFSHTEIYIMTIGLLIPAGLGIFCCYFFWCGPAILACQPVLHDILLWMMMLRQHPSTEVTARLDSLLSDLMRIMTWI